jgi:hypothetical protein|tara:strand:+ start:98 stop:331 length:234 start_codon:yes stop_codon:yes gene_type:complete
MKIEKVLNPDSGVLNYDSEDGVYTISIVDAEIDEVECELFNDDCITLKTDGLSYVKLSRDNLENLLFLIDEVENENK